MYQIIAYLWKKPPTAMVETYNFGKNIIVFISILICILLFPLNTLATKTNDIEQLKRELGTTSGKQKLEVLNNLVRYYHEKSHKETDKYLTQYLDLAKENNSLIDQALAYHYYSELSLLQIEYQKSINYTRKALKLYETLGDTLNIYFEYAKLSRAFLLLHQPDSAMKTINKTIKYFEKHQGGKSLLRVKIQLGKAYFISNRFTKAREVLQEVVNESKNLNQYSYVAWALYWLGDSNVKLGNFSEAITNFTEEINIQDSINNVSGKLGGMQELGDIYLKIGEFAKAYQLYFDCFQQKDIMKDYRGEMQFTAEYHTNLGKIYQNTQRYQKALDQFDTAIRIINQFDFSTTRGIIYNMIGQTYLKMDELNMALHHFEQSLIFYKEIKNKYNIAITQNHIAEVYMNMGQFDTAVAYLKIAKQTNTDIKNKYGESLNHKNLAECYYNQKKYKKVKEELDAGMPYVSQSGIDELILEYYSIYIMYYNKTSNYSQAKLYMDKFLALSNKITLQHTQNLSDLLIRIYNNELNTRTEYLNQTIELQSLEAKNNAIKFQRLLLFTLVMILIIIISGILYYFNLRNAKKLKRLIDERTHTICENEQKLIEMSNAKNKMYSIIAHDLRSPFNALLGFSKLLYTNYDNLTEEEKKKYIKIVHNSSNKFFALLENLLEWTRSSSNGIKYKPAQQDLSLIIKHIIQLQERNTKEKGITIINNVPLNTFVFADENMLRTIVRNLTSNAIKFTNSGGYVKYYASESSVKMVKCTVQDNGIGIAPEDIQNLFNADSKIRRRGTANEGGTGLGLILIKEFVEKNNGKLTVESKLGEGSTFSFDLPIQ